MTTDNAIIYQSFFENSFDAMLISDSEGKIIKANNAFFDSTNYCPQQIIDKNITFSISTRHNVELFLLSWQNLKNNECWEGEIWYQKQNDEEFLCSQKVTVIRNENDELQYYNIVFKKVSRSKKSEHQFWYLAHYDSLTGLVNRRFLEQRLDEEISAANRSNFTGGLLFFDLDNFKKINDSLGHKMGDQVLINIAKLIQIHLRKEDVFCRLGGDEFVILFNSLSQDIEIAIKMIGKIIQKILNTLREPLIK
jgi:diguanylate cyclase (GGDEF)-like protein/PAS domain S-box-containing protein